MSETFGIHPWDVGRLSAAELEVYLRALRVRADEYQKMQRR